MSLDVGQVLADLREQRAETARELAALDAAIEAIGAIVSPGSRAGATRGREPERRTVRQGNARRGAPPAVKRASAPAARTPAVAEEPRAFTGRLPTGGEHLRFDGEHAERDARQAARHLVGRGFRRSTSRPMKPGEFDLLKSAKRGEYHLLYVPRPEDGEAEAAA